jgi:hypothetical protein
MSEDTNEEPSEHTGKVLLAARAAVHDEMGAVKRIQFWATLGLTILGLGFGAAMFLNRYAAAEDVEKLSDKTEDISKQMQSHILHEGERLRTVEVQGKNIEEDYHWQREQLQRIADRVGAARVAPPKEHHKEEEAP